MQENLIMITNEYQINQQHGSCSSEYKRTIRFSSWYLKRYMKWGRGGGKPNVGAIAYPIKCQLVWILKLISEFKVLAPRKHEYLGLRYWNFEVLGNLPICPLQIQRLAFLYSWNNGVIMPIYCSLQHCEHHENSGGINSY